MTTLIPKFDLKDGGATPIGAVNRPINEKLAEFVSVKDFGAVGDGIANDTAAIQNAVNTGSRIFFPNGTYNINATITINSPYQQFIGESRTSTVINNTNTSVYAFTYLSAIQAIPYDIDSGMAFECLTIQSKYGIQLNQSGDFATVFNLQGHIKDIRIIQCSFIGTYTSAVDPNSNTNIYPTDAELFGYGIGLRCAKLFDSLIQNCYFVGNGIGIYFDGCDINNIDTNRLNANARHIQLQIQATYGYQTKIQNNDILLNYRMGAIYDTCAFTSVKDNYFETDSLAAQQYTVRGGWGQLFWGNRIDNARFGTPILSLAPTYGMVVSNNRRNPSSPTAPIEILSTNYTPNLVGVDNNYLVTFSGNSGTFGVPEYPWCEYDFNNPRVFDYLNPKLIAGNQATVFPFKLSAITGSWVVATANPSLLVYLNTYAQDTAFTVKFAGTRLTGGGFVNIKWGGTTVFNGSLGFTSTTFPEVKTASITLPAGILGQSGLVIELVNNEVEYESFELIPS
jgi:hypothetical protein